jgi:hypothetical protein
MGQKRIPNKGSLFNENNLNHNFSFDMRYAIQSNCCYINQPKLNSKFEGYHLQPSHTDLIEKTKSHRNIVTSFLTPQWRM